MRSWRFGDLGDLAEVTVGPAFKSNYFTDDPLDIRLLRGANVGVGALKWGATMRWPRSDVSDYERFFLAPGDAIVAMDRPWIEAGLKVATVETDDVPALLVQRVARLRAVKASDQRFLRAVLASPDFSAYLKGIAGGSAVPHVSADDIRRFKFQIPPREIQRRIGSVCSAFDELIEINERRIELLEQTARSLYRNWFIHLRFPGAETSKVRDTSLGRVPVDWNVFPLSEIARITMGQSARSEEVSETVEGPPFHQGVSDFGSEVPTTSRYCASARRHAEPLDILCSVRAPVGRLNVANQRLGIGRGLAAIRRRDGAQALLRHQLRQALGDEDSIGGGTIYKAIGKDQLSSLPVVEPNGHTVERFERVARPMLTLTVSLVDLNRSLCSRRDLLLPRLISGQLDLSDIDLGILTPTESE